MPANFFSMPAADLTRSANVFVKPDQAVLAHDLDGRIIDANYPFLDVTGFSRNALIGQSISIFREPDGGLARAQALALLQRGQAARADLIFHGVAGRLCSLAALLLPLTRKKGLCGVIIIGRDSGALGDGMPLPVALDQAA